MAEKVQVANPHEGHRGRVKQRFLQQGATAFAPHELVEMMLFFGIPRRDTNELAHRLMERFGSLSGLLEASYEELVAVPGMSENAATLVRMINALIVECQREQFSVERLLNTSDKMRDFAMRLLMGAEKEQVWMVCMNNNNRLLAHARLSEGCATSTEINVRQALQLALRCNATTAFLAHNHPGGQTSPSRADVESTRAIGDALRMAGVKLLDHFIVSGSTYSSMRDTTLYAPIFLGL